jgi:hypothetical protein
MKLSFALAPESIRDIVFAKRPPAVKLEAEIAVISLAAELDTRSHNNPKHACKAGYHRRDPFQRYYPGVWSSARQFFNCLAHTVANDVGYIFSMLGKVGDHAFVLKRRRMERSLGRLEYIGAAAKSEWEARRETAAKANRSPPPVHSGGESSEHTDSDGEEPTQTSNCNTVATAPNQNVPRARLWWETVRFPFEASSQDVATLDTLATHCKFWADEHGSPVLNLPAQFFKGVAQFKIHDKYCLTGAPGAYMVGQCEDLGVEVRKRLIAYLFALENVILKSVKRSEVASRQAELTKARAALYPVLPLYITGSGVGEQLLHWAKQVYLLLPTLSKSDLVCIGTPRRPAARSWYARY